LHFNCKKVVPKFPLCLVLGLLANQLMAQAPACRCHLHGKVAGNGVALAHASIQLVSPQRQTLTNTEGFFAFDQLCPGEYEVQVHSQGYTDQRVRCRVDSGLYLNIRLEEKTVVLAGVTVLGERPVASAAQVAPTLGKAELDRARGGSLGESLRDITGIHLLQTGPTIAKPMIHGLHSNRVLVLNNGIRQEGQQWGSEHAPEIDPFMATKLTVVKGAAAVRYGADALGGVIVVTPPDLPRTPGLAGELHLVGQTQGRQGTVSGNLAGYTRGLGWRLQATGKRGGNLHTPNYFLANTGLRELNFSGTVGYQRDKAGIELFYSRFATEIGILASAHIGNLTDLNFALASPRPVYPDRFSDEFTYRIQAPRQQVAHHLAKAQGYAELGWGKLTFQYGFQANARREYDVRRLSSNSARPALDLRLLTHTLDVVLAHRPVGALRGSVGLSGLFQDNDNIPGTGIRPLVPNYRVGSGGIFLTEKWATRKFEVEAGLRYDYRHLSVWRFDRSSQLLRPEYNFHNVSGTLGAYWELAEQLKLRSVLASAWRPPAPNELFSEGLHHGAAALEFGRDDLRPEQAYKWTTSLERTGKAWAWELTGYYQAIGNYIYLNPQLPPALTIRGAFPVFHYDQTDARFWGLDGSLRVEVLPGLHYSAKGSLVRARDVRSGAYLPWIPPDRIENALTWRRERGAKREYYCSLSSLSVARQWRYEAERDYAPPPSGYTLVNLDAGAAWPIGKQRLALNLSVRNLANLTYRDYLNRFRYFADEAGRNVILRLHYSFGNQ
jgi:iron complex outermembrane receptor protein